MSEQAEVADPFEGAYIDPRREIEGVVVPIDVPNGHPLKVKLRRAGGKNAEYKKAFEKATKPYMPQLKVGMKLEEDVQARILAEAFADAVILDWRYPVIVTEADPENEVAEVVEYKSGVYDFDMRSYQPVTRDRTIAALLRFPKKRVFDKIVAYAMEDEVFLLEQNEAQAKN